MHSKHLILYLGAGYFFLMIILKNILPEWTGNENSIIENLQLLWLLAGFSYCYKAKKSKFQISHEEAQFLWNAGMIYFFLLFMREISWGRTFITNTDGSNVQYSQLGLYGKIVHPVVATLIIMLIILLFKARFWKILLSIYFPIKAFCLLLVFIFAAWIAERTSFTYFHGQVAEELAEFGAYMMMFFLVHNTGEQSKNSRT